MKFFFQKTLFFEITPKFERFEKSYYFSPIIRPICYFYLFLKFSFFSKNPSPFWEKKWTFWEILNFQSHSTTIFLSSAIFKSWCFFWKNSSNFFIKKKLNVLKTFTISVSFYGKFAKFDTFHQFENKIFAKTHLCLEKPQNLNVLRSLRNSVAFYGKFATFSCL